MSPPVYPLCIWSSSLPGGRLGPSARHPRGPRRRARPEGPLQPPGRPAPGDRAGRDSQDLGQAGVPIEFDDDIRAEIERAADELASGEDADVPARLCAICRSIRERAAAAEGAAPIRGGCEGTRPNDAGG